VDTVQRPRRDYRYGNQFALVHLSPVAAVLAEKPDQISIFIEETLRLNPPVRVIPSWTTETPKWA
jgi:cytochrome P450